MYICPRSGGKLKVARAKGGRFWISPVSGGRMLTLAMSRHFLGQHETQELWMRSENAPINEQVKCPSCTRPMREVQEPGWMQSAQVDVCRSCHLIWLDRGEHSEVPHPEDFDHHVAEIEKRVAKTKVVAQQLEQNEKDEKVFGDGPPKLLSALPAFLGLPVEMSDRATPLWPLVTALLITGMLLLHYFFGGYPDNIAEYGFHPADPFKNYGLNVVLSIFLHADWLHLLGNLYFFGMLGDDVEEEMGGQRFLLLIFLTAAVTSLIWALSGGGDGSPYVGLNGVIMALILYYSIRFPRARMAYMIPALHHFSPRPGAHTFLRGFQWMRLSVKWVTLIYLLYFFSHFYLRAKEGSLALAISALVVGSIVGALFALSAENRDLQED